MTGVPNGAFGVMSSHQSADVIGRQTGDRSSLGERREGLEPKVELSKERNVQFVDLEGLAGAEVPNASLIVMPLPKNSVNSSASLSHNAPETRQAPRWIDCACAREIRADSGAWGVVPRGLSPPRTM